MNSFGSFLHVPPVLLFNQQYNSTAQNGIEFQYNEYKNTIIIKGESTGINLEHPLEKVIDISRYHLSRKDRLKIFVKLSSINAGMVKSMFNLLKTLNFFHLQQNKVTVVWLCDWDNDDMIATGFDLASLYPFPMHVYPV